MAKGFVFLFFVFNAYAQTYLGNFTSYSINGRCIKVNAGSSFFNFTFYKPDIVRVDFYPDIFAVMDSSFTITADTSEQVSISLIDDDSTLNIISSGLKISCNKNPLRLSFYNSSGSLLTSEPFEGGISYDFNERTVNFNINSTEHFYGTGARGISLDLRGTAFESYNTQNYGYANPLPTMAVNIPVLLSTNGFGIFIDNTYKGWFDIGSSNWFKWSYKASDGEISYYLFSGEDYNKLLEHYTFLTGRQPMPPKWALGFLQSKFGYRNETEARAMVNTMRQKQIPCDAIILDIYWYNQMGDLSWKYSAWNPTAMIPDFLAEGFKTILITQPYFTELSSNYFPGIAEDVFVKNTQGQPYILSNWWSCGCNAALIDFTNPPSREWFWNKHLLLMNQQIAGLWTDLGEPERHPEDMIHHIGTANKVHNIFNLLWAKTVYEGFNSARPGERIFNLTRSGFAGSQRYGVFTWSGDVGRNFSGLAVQLPMMLNMSLSGLSYHHSDIGGFCCGTTTPELYVRWMQHSTFSPVARAHGEDSQPKEPWGYGQQAEEICKKFIQLRYQLLPYIYTLAYENHSSGKPVIKPLIAKYPDDPNLINDYTSYLYGDNILISPIVTEGAAAKNVYLPADRWIDYWTDNLYQGSNFYSVNAPLDKMPLFIKEGSIIPMQPVMNYTDEFPLDTLILSVYPSQTEQVSYTLYEDDGKTTDYLIGSFSKINFVQSISSIEKEAVLNLSISSSPGNYNGKPQSRIYLSDIHRIFNIPSGVNKNSIPLIQRQSYAELRTNEEGYYYNAQSRRLYVQIKTVPDSSYNIEVQNAVLNNKEVITSVYDFALEQNYPNPFNSTSIIRYSIPSPSHVSVDIFDILGNRVLILVNEAKPAGIYETKINGEGLSSGIYFYRLRAGQNILTKKMILIK